MIRGPTPFQGKGAETESKPACYTFSREWKNMWGVKLITYMAFRAKKQNDH